MQSYNASKTKSKEEPAPSTIIFSLDNTLKGLSQVVCILEKQNVALHHIESRSSLSDPEAKEFLAVLESDKASEARVMDTLELLKECVKSLEVVEGGENDTVWFPRTLEEMNPCLTRPLYSELEPSHPGAKDPEYQALRKMCWNIAHNYTIGTPIPVIEYTESQIKTFGAIYSKLKILYPTNACKEFNEIFPDLVKECNISEDHIPQMEDVSQFVKKRTGFVLRPVSALLSARDFLSALAFHVFPATQYLRHPSSPFYTPEPDLCHELLGHCALLANPEFAQFSQEIGLASLGAPDEYIEKLASVYWFTVEFGVCKESTGRKAYGAGLLSSVAEIQYFLTDEPKVKPFDTSTAITESYPVEGFQTTYFLAESFSDALQKIRAFAATIPRPFTVRYNPYTQSIEVLDSKEKLLKVAEQLNGELNRLMDGILKLK
ncbi:phenylalanine-4-hydroxylase-like isoform X2 [Acanthaster planci]|uniref:phenylalanine 4-monooxygenase n=1 Tax=Acanthaster planci TaxID=133434 RepID=A0A8B7Z0P3_ACAPL|nr:phenylalanine-4-hydroxylase-like isoform X2 [Acanthaster planci]